MIEFVQVWICLELHKIIRWASRVPDVKICLKWKIKRLRSSFANNVYHQLCLTFLVEKNHKQHENPKKGRTWGPSSNYQKNKRAKFRTRLYSGETSTVQHHGRSSSFPNLGIAIARPDHLDSQTPNQLSMIFTFMSLLYLYLPLWVFTLSGKVFYWIWLVSVRALIPLLDKFHRPFHFIKFHFYKSLTWKRPAPL